VIAIDHIPERLEMARRFGKAETLDFDAVDVAAALTEMTGGLGPDACIDAVGLESHGHTLDALYDRVKQAAWLATDRIHALRQAIYCCRKGGTVSMPGVYGGLLDKVPMGSAFSKGLTLKMGQTHVHRYMRPLLERIQGNGRPGFDPSYIVTHRFPLEQASHAYGVFNKRHDDCIKVVLNP
jgi:threonine dehydrogenase-like Zn-dependent dehydrogenase